MNNNNKQDNIRQAFQSRNDKLKQIDALYREEIKKIYNDTKSRVEKVQQDNKKSQFRQEKKQTLNKKPSNNVIPNLSIGSKYMQSPKSASTLNVPESQSSSKMFLTGNQAQDRIRASVFLKGESTRTIELLRRQNESKELKIRQLSNKCQNLVQKLKKYLTQSEFQSQMENLRKFSDGKMQRLEHLFKIKQEEIFFKIKLQVIGLLQQFGIQKNQLGEFNDISSESNLFTLMTRKLKTKLKDFRSKQQESNFELQKDKIVNQKQEQKIHYLTETNELLKLSQTKLKSKIEDLKYQLNQFLQKLKTRERENEQNENELFRVRKQNEQIQTNYQRLQFTIKTINQQRIEDKKIWQIKQKQMKSLLNNYFIQKKKLETDIQEKDGEIQEIIIKYKFLEQENQRINRELIRWKERYEWQEKQKTIKIKDIEQQKLALISQFEEYKNNFNREILINQKNQVDEAIKKIEEYQRAYQRVVIQLQEQKNLLRRCEQEYQERLESEERQWLERFKGLERIKEEQLFEINSDCEQRIREIRQQYSKREELSSQQMQARLRALLAERDKKTTQQLIELQTQNDQLRRDINDLNKIIEVKQSLINVINNKRIES